jgi:HlyD family secretion protein
MTRATRHLALNLGDVLPKASPSPFKAIRSLSLMALLMILVFVVGFGVWAMQAPLESAAIATGAIEAESSRKTVQHLEGGIVGQILVKDGDEVSAGQALIRLDDTRARTKLSGLQGQLWDAQARETRLLTERDGFDELKFSIEISEAARSDPAIAEVLDGQRKIFQSRRKLWDAQTSVVKQKIAQIEREIVGLQAQEAATRKRIQIVGQELEVVVPLVARGMETRVRLLKLEREQAEIEGRRGEALAQISRARQAVGEYEAQILRIQNESHNEITQSLRDTQSQIFQLTERIQAARDVLSRTEVRSPEAGTITDLRIHTPGGVIAAGEPLMDLVPKWDQLIIRAQVRPEDIDLVRPGLEARVRLLPYKQRRVPPLDASLTYVSADRLLDKKTEQPYYVAKIRINEQMLQRLEGVEIMPGMPVEVLIKTGKFTVAHYALSPLLDSFNRSFREQ